MVSPLQAALADRSAAGIAVAAAEEDLAHQAARERGYGEAAVAAAQHLQLECEELDAARRHKGCCAVKVSGSKWAPLLARARVRPHG